jgi:hypothetical protein
MGKAPTHARRLFAANKSLLFLYELEVDAEKVLFRGDLNSYSAAVDAVTSRQMRLSRDTAQANPNRDTPVR